MDDREVSGVRRAITWLHDEAKTMNDPNAVIVLNNAAFHLGVALSKWRKPQPRYIEPDGSYSDKPPVHPRDYAT